jgi:hypothetical protein
METQIFHHAKNIIFKKSSKRNQNPSTYYNSITNLKFSHFKPKYHFFQKSSYKNRPIRYLGGPKSIKLLYILYNESKHNILALIGKANKSTFLVAFHLSIEIQTHILFGNHAKVL